MADADRRGRARKSETRCPIPRRASRRTSPGRRRIRSSRRIARSSRCRTTRRRRRWPRCCMPCIRTTGYFTLSDARNDQRCSTTAGRSSRRQADGKHRYLIVDPAQKARDHELYTRRWSRRRRRRGPGVGVGASMRLRTRCTDSGCRVDVAWLSAVDTQRPSAQAPAPPARVVGPGAAAGAPAAGDGAARRSTAPAAGRDGRPRRVPSADGRGVRRGDEGAVRTTPAASATTRTSWPAASTWRSTALGRLAGRRSAIAGSVILTKLEVRRDAAGRTSSGRTSRSTRW